MELLVAWIADAGILATRCGGLNSASTTRIAFDLSKFAE